jgi:hypothetical protein
MDAPCCTARLSKTCRPADNPPMANILVGVFAIVLCLINAAVWTFVSDLPLAGIGWVGAAVACIWLQKWSRGY